MGNVSLISDLLGQIGNWRKSGEKIVFTNGCFDVLHRGHVEYLQKSKSFGDRLIVGVNSDSSVRQLKGSGRPFVGEEDRAYIISQLVSVDAAILFSDETPYDLINQIKPDVLVKGGDYQIHEVVGRDIVESHGGRVVIVPLVTGRSTTNIIDKIRSTENQRGQKSGTTE